MPTTIVIETFPEFVERHGGRPVTVNHRLLLPNGASTDLARDLDRREPPANPFHRLNLQRQYWNERLQRAESDFRRLKQALRGWGMFSWPEKEYGPSPGGGLQALLKIRDAVLGFRAKIAQIDAGLEETPEVQEKRRREEFEADLRNRAMREQVDLIGKVDAVEI